MNLVVDKVMEFEEVHISDSHAVVEFFARASVKKLGLAVEREIRFFEHLDDIALVSAVKYGSHDLVAECLGRSAQMNLQHLSDVHT